mgnify:CR=1 FL=1
MLQYIITGLIIALSVAYAAWRIYSELHAPTDPCAGCRGCAMQELRRKNGENRHCPEKKRQKNLAE